MSTYAIIKTGGKQVKVEVGQAVYVEKLNVEAGQEVTFNLFSASFDNCVCAHHAPPMIFMGSPI